MKGNGGINKSSFIVLPDKGSLRNEISSSVNHHLAPYKICKIGKIIVMNEVLLVLQTSALSSLFPE